MLNNRQSIVILNSLSGIGPVKIRALRRHHPDMGEIFGCSIDELCCVKGITPANAEKIRHWSESMDIEMEMKLARDCGVQIVTFEDEMYPPALRELPDAPALLYVRGDLETLHASGRCIALVGSRHTSLYGEKVARDLALAAIDADMTVVSGLAMGIDTIVHKAAVDACGRTIAVLGSGLCHVYPPKNISLADAIVRSSGAIVSENPMTCKPDRSTFPIRNRIISGLSRGTIVVEAGLQSGSLITATQALEQGRSVFAVPGRVDTMYAKGCHSLLRDGAVLVETFQDVLDELNLLPIAREQSARRHSPPKEETLSLYGLELAIWQSLPQDSPMAMDDIICSFPELAPSQILTSIMLLEVKGGIRQLPGKMVQRIGKLG